MRRADRLFQIIQYLRQRRLTTAKWLSEKLEVSERTIYRDIKDLMLSGVPIDGEAGVGYILRKGFEIPPLMFTKDEVEALVVATRMAKTWVGSNVARSAQSALDKIEAVLPHALKHELSRPKLYVPKILSSDLTADTIDSIRGAIKKKRIIYLEYNSINNETSERDVVPLGVFFWGKCWTLASWCLNKQSYRSFRLDRIKTLNVSQKQFSDSEAVSISSFVAQNYAELDISDFIE